MNKYTVYVLEIHQIQFETEAIDKADAIDKAVNGDGRWIDNSMELVDSMGSDHWIVEMTEEGIGESV